MTKWKCKLSGNIVELPDSEEDNMVGHDQYERVEEQEEQPVQPTRGRPPKNQVKGS